MDTGTIVGIVLGVLAAAVIVFVIIFLYLSKRKKGEWLITDKLESPVAYSNGGFAGERVNVVDYTEIPFAFAQQVKPMSDVPPQKSDVLVPNGTTRDEVAKNSTVQTSSSSVDKAHENSTMVSVSANDAFHEIDFHNVDDDDYATLDSVAKIRSKEADASDKRKSNHAAEVQHIMPQQAVPDEENECEYATVVPKSLRGNKDSFREKTGVIDNIDLTSDLFHANGTKSLDPHSEISDYDIT